MKPESARPTPEAKQRIRECRDVFEEMLTKNAAFLAARESSTQIRDSDIDAAYSEIMRPAARRRGLFGLGLSILTIVLTTAAAIFGNIAANRVSADLQSTPWWIATGAVGLLTVGLVAYRDFGSK